MKRSRQSSKENTSQAVLSQRRGMILDAYIGLLADIRGTDIERRAGIDAARGCWFWERETRAWPRPGRLGPRVSASWW